MSNCQHCGQEVSWGRTEQGFSGFVHTTSGLAACPAAGSYANDGWRQARDQRRRERFQG
jgi:hypothetical protein